MVLDMKTLKRIDTAEMLGGTSDVLSKFLVVVALILFLVTRPLGMGEWVVPLLGMRLDDVADAVMRGALVVGLACIIVFRPIAFAAHGLFETEFFFGLANLKEDEVDKKAYYERLMRAKHAAMIVATVLPGIIALIVYVLLRGVVWTPVPEIVALLIAFMLPRVIIEPIGMAVVLYFQDENAELLKEYESITKSGEALEDAFMRYGR